VLLFHEQIQLIEPVHGRAVFVDVVLKGLEKANEGNAAFVFNGFAHCSTGDPFFPTDEGFLRGSIVSVNRHANLRFYKGGKTQTDERTKMRAVRC
jgi:hypothetical protein